MKRSLIVLIAVLSLSLFACEAYAEETITFYWRAVTSMGTQADGMYHGELSSSTDTALEQQRACEKWAKSKFSPTTQFIHLSCTPLTQPGGVSSNKGPWGDTINQNGQIRLLLDEEQDIEKDAERVGHEVETLMAKFEGIVREDEALGARVNEFNARCDREFIVPDEQAEVDECIAEQEQLAGAMASLQERFARIKGDLDKRAGEMETLAHDLEVIRRKIKTRVDFQSRAGECTAHLSGQEAWDCLDKLWREITDPPTGE
jgi:hypothetical protein